jgi:ABC-2 type transport system permease protein
MNLRRILILLRKELFQGPRNMIFLFALVVPVVFTLVINLIFGNFFSGRSRLGIVDQGDSDLVPLAQDSAALIVRTFDTEAELRDATGRGVVDMGLSIPAGFDNHLRSSELAKITVYVWGESQMQNRVILGSALVSLMRQVAGQETPVQIVETVLGAGVNIPWEKRLLPFVVLMTITLSGAMVPATSMVTEKTKRTLSALAVSPTTVGEIYTAKALLGVILSMATGVLTLFLNQAFGGQPVLLLGVLLLGAIFSATLGIMAGSVVKDISTLFALVKSVGILLYAPAIIYMFPGIPQWIGRLFPTYYVLQPVLEISQENAGFAHIAPEVGALVGLIVVAVAVLAVMARRTQESQALA